MKQAALVLLLAGLTGFTLGAGVFGYATWVIGMFFLSHIPAGIHSDWAIIVVFGTLMSFGLGGVAGAVGPMRFAKSRHS